MSDTTILPVLNLSFSSADSWERGYKEDALKAILHVGDPREPSEAMIEGKKWHKQWEDEIRKTQQVPEIFGYKLESKVIPELKQYHNFMSDDKEYMIKLTGVIDMMTEDQSVLADHKCTRKDINEHFESMQMPCYALLLPTARYGYFNGFHPDSREVNVIGMHLTRYTRQLATEWLKKIAKEVVAECKKQDISFERLEI